MKGKVTYLARYLMIFSNPYEVVQLQPARLEQLNRPPFFSLLIGNFFSALIFRHSVSRAV